MRCGAVSSVLHESPSPNLNWPCCAHRRPEETLLGRRSRTVLAIGGSFAALGAVARLLGVLGESALVRHRAVALVVETIVVGVVVAVALIGNIALFPTSMVVMRNVRRAHGAVVTLVLGDLALHVPVPLVDLALLEAQALLQLNDLRLVPHVIFLELVQQNFILLLVLPEPLLCLTSASHTMPDDDTRDFGGANALRCVGCRSYARCGVSSPRNSLVLLVLEVGRLLRVGVGALSLALAGLGLGRVEALRGGRFGLFLSVLNGGGVLLNGSFGALLEEGVDALVEVVRDHVVVDDAEAGNVDGVPVRAVHVVLDAAELTLLLDDLDLLAAWPTSALPNTLLIRCLFSRNRRSLH